MKNPKQDIDHDKERLYSRARRSDVIFLSKFCQNKPILKPGSEWFVIHPATGKSVRSGRRNISQVVFGQALKAALRRSLAESGFLANRRPGRAAFAQRSNLAGIHDYARPSEPLALGPRILQTCPDARGNEAVKTIASAVTGR